MKEEEKKDYEEQIKKLKTELGLLKLRNIKQQNKNDSLVSNYRNIIKLISNKYIKKYSIYVICAIILIFTTKKL